MYFTYKWKIKIINFHEFLAYVNNPDKNRELSTNVQVKAYTITQNILLQQVNKRHMRIILCSYLILCIFILDHLPFITFNADDDRRGTRYQIFYLLYNNISYESNYEIFNDTPILNLNVMLQNIFFE